eukprot:5765577-Pyramimonas_sp.AAC.1
MSFRSTVDRSRLTGLLLELPGLPRLGLMCAYFKAAGGLGEVNLGLLADIAVQQDQERVPIIVAGDFNLSPSRIESLDYLHRASLQVVAPSSPTFRVKKTQSVLDYFII